MIVVWVNKRDWRTPGPIVNVAVRNAASFAGLGVETHLCIGAGEPSDTGADLREFYGIEPPPTLYIHRIPRLRVGRSTYSLPVFRNGVRLVRSLARRDEVAVFTRESGFLRSLPGLRRRLPVRGFYELHDLYADLSWVERKKSRHIREWLLERLFLPRIDGLVCITAAQRDRYRKLFPNLPAVAAPLGTIPRPVADPEDRRVRRTLVYVGRVHGDKGADLLLRASGNLADRNVRTLFLGGGTASVERLEARAAAMGVNGCVSFSPFLPPEEMHRILADRASVGVVMLRDTYYNRYLTCPVKALDYLSHGLPAIGSDLPSVREVTGDAGIHIPPDDPDAFADAALRLLDDPETYREYARRAARRARVLSWKNRARRLLGFAGTLEPEPAADGRNRRGVP